MSLEQRSNWIDENVLIDFFGDAPFERNDTTLHFRKQFGNMIVRLELSQFERFAQIELYEKEDAPALVSLPLPYYSSLEILKDELTSSLIFGPPFTLDELSSGGGAVVCPVVLQLKPSVSLIFKRGGRRVQRDF